MRWMQDSDTARLTCANFGSIFMARTLMSADPTGFSASLPCAERSPGGKLGQIMGSGTGLSVLVG